MANVFLTNRALPVNNHAFSTIWGLTRALKKAGAVYLGSSDGTTKETTGVATADLWGGNADPALDAYPSGLDTVSAWWACKVVSTWKIPVGTYSSGTFLRGEKVTQATSGAEGEILGFMYDAGTPSNSYLVVIVQTGTFNGTNLITGGTSLATITPSGSPTEYQGQIVFWKDANITHGTAYYMRATTAEGQFNALFSAAGCTATVPPGGGGTGNAFPTLAVSMHGTGGSASHFPWFIPNLVGNGKYQAVATNHTPASSVTPDGTFWLMLGCPAYGAGYSTGFGFFRCDDTEDGDLDPFVFYWPANNPTRTVAVANTTDTNWSHTSIIYSASWGYYGGWRRRGFASADAWQRYYPCQLCFRFGSTNYVMLEASATIETVACTTDSQKVREPVWMAAVGTPKHRKGSLRWMYWVPSGAAYEDWDALNFIQVYSANPTYTGIMLGPWDGVTTPLQA